MSELSLQRRRSGAISGSERITGVKNAQADVLLSRKKQQYDTLMKKREQDIQLEEYKLTNDNKVLNLENKKNDLEYKKRLYPQADLSNEEMAVVNQEKYLVRSGNKLCYTDKSLSNKVRHRASTETVPPIVAEARLTIVRREIIKAVEQNRKHMYSFLEKPVSRQDKKRLRQGTEIDAFDELEKVLEENTLPGFAGHLMPTKKSPEESNELKHKNEQYLALPTVEKQVLAHSHPPPSSTKKQPKNPGLTLKVPMTHRHKSLEARETEEIHHLIKQNPVLKDAIENQHKEKALQDTGKPRQPISEVLTRMARKKPPTKSQMQAELDNVQNQVSVFCTRIEELLWAYKEEAFQQQLRFVKDKDAELNRFMDTMQKRNRVAAGERSDTLHEYHVTVEPKKRPMTQASSYIPNTRLTEKQKESIIMRNLLINRPRQVESAPVRKRGIPHHMEKRSQHHSPTAKLQRMLEKNRSLLDAVVKGQNSDRKEEVNGGLVAATKQVEMTAR